MSAQDNLSPAQFSTGYMRVADLTPSVNMREIQDDPPSRTDGPLMVAHAEGVSTVVNGNHRYRDALNSGQDEVHVNVRHEGAPPRMRDAQQMDSVRYWMSA